jgi:hypothetical protein
MKKELTSFYAMEIKGTLSSKVMSNYLLPGGKEKFLDNHLGDSCLK